MESGDRPLRVRHAQRRVEDALGDTRVVVVLGARQVGKSTLAQTITDARGGWESATFDDKSTRDGAEADPTGFIASLSKPAAIDEIQRVPDVLLAIKQHVDRHRAPGQFLLTGSANILTAPKIADALTGRTEYIRLHPFTQTELLERADEFLDTLFTGAPPRLARQPVGRRPYAPIIATGGYPEALDRSGVRRRRFFSSYVETALDRDLQGLATVSDVTNVRSLLRAIAAVSGSELNFSSLSRDLRVSDNTLRTYTNFLEMLFMVRRVPPWSNNLLARTVKSPKVYIADTGLLAALIGADERRIETDLNLGGSLFESFVANEIARLIDVHDTPHSLYHLRDRNQLEVDLVIERPDGSIAAVEVKASATASPRDFKGLRYLRDHLGERFAYGVVLYTGEQTVPVGERLAAVPISALWGGFPTG